MATSQFQWQSGQDQAYTADYGSQTLHKETFDKDCGTTFRLQASGEQLSLVPQSDAESHWGGTCSGLPTTMFLQDGTLQYGSPDENSTLQMDSTDLVLQNAAVFSANINIYRAVSDTSVNRINLSDSSSVDVTCRLSFSTSGSIQINDTSHMTVTSAAISLNRCALGVSSRLPMDRASLNLIVPAGRPDELRFFQVNSSVIECTGSSKTVFRIPQGKSLTFTNSTVMALGNSRLEIYADDIGFSARDNTQFQVYGSGAFVFNGATPTSAPFDFLHKSYPPGLFRFVAPPIGPEAMFLIRKCGNAFSFSAMLNNQLIYIDGKPATDDKNIIHDYVDGDLVLKYKF